VVARYGIYAVDARYNAIFKLEIVSLDMSLQNRKDRYTLPFEILGLTPTTPYHQSAENMAWETEPKQFVS